MSRLEILKTYKLFIGGQFPRTESGRYYVPQNAKGEGLGNICLSSRKDVRNAVSAARKAMSWSERSAFNRGQILYRMAEMMEGRKAQFIDELKKHVENGLAQKKFQFNTGFQITVSIATGVCGESTSLSIYDSILQLFGRKVNYYIWQKRQCPSGNSVHPHHDLPYEKP